MKILFFVMLGLLGAGSIGIHSSTSWMDNAGLVHEPFFVFVIVGFVLLATSIVGLITSIIFARVTRHRRSHRQ